MGKPRNIYVTVDGQIRLGDSIVIPCTEVKRHIICGIRRGERHVVCNRVGQVWTKSFGPLRSKERSEAEVAALASIEPQITRSAYIAYCAFLENENQLAQACILSYEDYQQEFLKCVRGVTRRWHNSLHPGDDFPIEDDPVSYLQTLTNQGTSRLKYYFTRMKKLCGQNEGLTAMLKDLEAKAAAGEDAIAELLRQRGQDWKKKLEKSLADSAFAYTQIRKLMDQIKSAQQSAVKQDRDLNRLSAELDSFKEKYEAAQKTIQSQRILTVQLDF